MSTKTLEEYNDLVELQQWNIKFSVPPVSTAAWNEEDWKRWEESRKPLPSFEEWKDQ